MIQGAKRWVLERLGINRIAMVADGAASAAQDTAARQSETEAHAGRIGHSLRETQRLVERVAVSAGDRARVLETTIWAAHAPLRHDATISIVLATRDRAHLLSAAVDSVRGQTYDRWQLVIVDDGSADETANVLSSLARSEDRIVVERTDGWGAGAARNVGLQASTGDFVTFLDDDNVMHPGWLRSIVEYTGRNPDCDALFGAQLREDRIDEEPVPRMFFFPGITVDELRHDNAIDLGVLAVRREHPELHFDESLDRFIDWEMIVRIAESSGIEPHPVLASLYTMRAAGNRISELGDERLDAMRQRLARQADPSDG